MDQLIHRFLFNLILRCGAKRSLEGWAAYSGACGPPFETQAWLAPQDEGDYVAWFALRMAVRSGFTP